ncbi:MAG: AbrB/MazE/SpoVT family DNA-binding domain-containing protein [Vicinamibacteria bacterium]|nr:AbrB/MazE/SpoVT family DNA-binding domain-containing protein [Vicinamibacteria bacterium]
MPTATTTSKGQITIPREVREHLHLEAGQRIEFIIDEAGQVTIIPATLDVRSIKGIFTPPQNTVTLQRMKDGIRRRGARKGPKR